MGHSVSFHRAIHRRLRLGKTVELCRNRGEYGLDIQGHLHGSNWFSKDFSNPLPHSFHDLEPLGHAAPCCLLPGPQGTPIFCAVSLLLRIYYWHISSLRSSSLSPLFHASFWIFWYVCRLWNLFINSLSVLVV